MSDTNITRTSGEATREPKPRVPEAIVRLIPFVPVLAFAQLVPVAR